MSVKSEKVRAQKIAFEDYRNRHIIGPVELEQLLTDNEKLNELRMVRRTVHLEPEHFRRCPCENCSECGKPTRHWLTPHIPLCQDCAWSSPNAKVSDASDAFAAPLG